METAMKVRRRILVNNESIRSVAKETGLSRNTIRKYCRDDSPPKYKRIAPNFSPKLKGFEDQLTQWFEFDLKRPKRERRTAQKLFEQLVLEGYKGSYSPVCRFVKKLRATQLSLNDAFIPLNFKAGDAMQFDWSLEVVVLDGVETRLKIAHFRLSHSRKPFIVAYPCETQEMLLDAFVQALSFYQGVPKRVLIDNPKTMVTKIGTGKQRDYHPRFLALMNHYLIEPVACTPASGWEKGQVENQVHVIRRQVFTPQLSFADLASLNQHLMACCEQLGKKPHPQQKDQSIDVVFKQEQLQLRALGKPFDGYVEKTVRVSSTCLVQYDTNHYSVPCDVAKQRISLRVYANKLVMVARQEVIAEHPRCFNKHRYHFEPWHYVPLLNQKPGALRDGAPFERWDLPKPILKIKKIYLQQHRGDRDFVQLLQLIQEHDVDTISMACELALEAKTTQLSAVINQIYRLTESEPPARLEVAQYPSLQTPPIADCLRYNQLLTSQEVA